ncbi:hypothetical protein [Sulfuricurvum sp.]|uniref:hypothetical protein n=1 Tax=Sulfuricurvum sp. TaxID=2025608 RepID=UPI00286E4636|nr:hypothetical protein [Sulfuricurvum sp.]
MKDFFKHNKVAIEKFINFTTKISDQPEYKKYNLQLCSNFLKSINESFHGLSFAANCSYNLKLIGQNFIEDISDTTYSNETYENVLIFLIRIAKEYEINAASNLPLSGAKLLKEYSAVSEDYPENINDQIYFTWHVMPYEIIKIKNNYSLEMIQNGFKDEIKKIISEDLPIEKKEINELKGFIAEAIQVLKDQKQKFSFVTLNKAFSTLEESKTKSKYIVLTLLCILVSLILYIPYHSYEQALTIQGAFNDFNLSLKGQENAPLFIQMSQYIPILLIEAILIYLFKIVLHKYNSLVDQIVQLETKQAIMQFIESYVDYKKDKNLTKDELERFEEVVFSKISPNLKDVPDLPNIITFVESFSKAIKK